MHTRLASKGPWAVARYNLNACIPRSPYENYAGAFSLSKDFRPHTYELVDRFDVQVSPPLAQGIMASNLSIDRQKRPSASTCADSERACIPLFVNFSPLPVITLPYGPIPKRDGRRVGHLGLICPHRHKRGRSGQCGGRPPP